MNHTAFSHFFRHILIVSSSILYNCLIIFLKLQFTSNHFLNPMRNQVFLKRFFIHKFLYLNVKKFPLRADILDVIDHSFQFAKSSIKLRRNDYFSLYFLSKLSSYFSNPEMSRTRVSSPTISLILPPSQMFSHCKKFLASLSICPYLSSSFQI